MKIQIYGMSFDRGTVIKRLSSKSDTLIVLVIKCVICKDTVMNKYILSDWIPEIATRISESSEYTWGRNKKLNQSDYATALFGSFGTTLQDSMINLRDFASRKGSDFDDYQQYLVVDYTNAQLVREICDEVINVFSKLLTNKQSYTKEELLPLLIDIFRDHLGTLS